MTIQNLKITENDFAGKDVASLDDAPQLSAQALKEAFDRLSKEVVIPAFNALIEALAADIGGTEIGQTVAGMSGRTVGALLNELALNKADKDSPGLTGTPTAPTAPIESNTAQIATTAFVKNALENAIIAAGAGDMTAGTYDPQGRATDVFAYADAVSKGKEYTVFLPAQGWVEEEAGVYRQAVAVADLPASGMAYICAPKPESIRQWGGAGAYMDEVLKDNTAVFVANSLPGEDITLRILGIRVE